MRFSVVIPCYNASAHLAEALASVAAQRLTPVEVIVVDDASTDGSAAIARRAGADVLAQPVNGGAAAARNAGIGVAAADAIAFLDADDLWTPDHLAELASIYAQAPDAGVAFAGVIDTRGRPIASPRRWPARTGLDFRWTLLAENPLAQSGTAVRTALLRDAGGYDARLRYAEDYDLWLRLSRRTTFACTHADTVTYRRHEAQASRNEAAMCEGMWSVRARALRRIEAEDAPPDVARARAVLLRAWERDLALSWHAGLTAELDALLAQHALVPDSRVAHARWRRWRQWAWGPVVVARRLARRLPGPLPRWLRRLRPTTPTLQ